MQPSYTGSCNVVASNVAAERHCVALVLGRSQLTFEFTCVVTAHDCVAIWVVSRVVSLCNSEVQAPYRIPPLIGLGVSLVSHWPCVLSLCLSFTTDASEEYWPVI